MSDIFKKTMLGIITVFVAILVSVALPFVSYVSPGALSDLSFYNGSADLSGYSIDGDKYIALSGEWEFYWYEHIISSPSEEREPDLYVEVPSAWTLYEIDGEKLHNGGIASYRTTVKNLDTDEPVLVSVKNLAGKCKVFIDGQYVFSNYTIPQYEGNDEFFYSYSVPVQLDQNIAEHEIVVEVSCEYSGGLTSIPELSTYHTYRHGEITSIAVRFIIVGICIFFVIGVVLLMIMSKDMSRQFWLVLLCIVFIFRMLISNEGYMVSHMLFGDLDYEIMTTFVYASTYIIKLCMLMHITKLLDLKIRHELLVLIAATFLICAFVPYFLYDYIYVATSYMWLQSFAYMVDAYLIFKLASAVIDKKRYSVPYLIFYCITATAIVVDNFYINGFISGDFSYVMPVACVIFIGFMVCLHLGSTVDAYKKARKSAELERELSELNTTLMISQIQPHFLYNALNTIKYTIKKDPKVAESAIIKFSNYLRANMDSLTQKEPIPIVKELEHVKNYIDIEQLRFGDRLNVEYDISAEDFYIPPLTIQPIVENAIKHGVNQKPEGGTVKISVLEDEKNYIINVDDDGVGYNVNQVKNDGRSHVGISNITKRLDSMLGATIEIASIEGEGTTVTVRIPKKDEEKD